MKREEDEKLWDLLGRATEPSAASPFFARNVMRKLREAQGESAPRRGWYFRWLVPAAGVAVVIIAGLALPTQIIKQHRSDTRPDIVAVSDSDSDLMADLDDLMGSDDSGLEDAVML
jgi:hypothetical protein